MPRGVFVKCPKSISELLFQQKLLENNGATFTEYSVMNEILLDRNDVLLLEKNIMKICLLPFLPLLGDYGEICCHRVMNDINGGNLIVFTGAHSYPQYVHFSCNS